MKNCCYAAFTAAYILAMPGHPVPSRDFLDWFVGYTEGRGVFFIGEGRMIISYRVAKEDVKNLEKIKSTLNLGSKIHYNSDNTCVLLFDNFIELPVLLLLFNGNMVIPSRRKQLEVFLFQWNSAYTYNSIKYIVSHRQPS
jgi:hypothetical protein